MKPTVKKIAALAGVSIGTVDRVLHERGQVSIKTRERVEKILEEQEYRPNILARQLSLGKEFVFKVLLPMESQDSGYWSLCALGIRKAANELSPFHIKVEISEFDRYDRNSIRRVLSRAAADPGDGILIAPIAPNAVNLFLSSLPAKLPYVFFDGRVEGAAPICEIGQDAWRSGFFAGRLISLLAKEEGTICAVNTHGEDLHIAKRIEGFRDFFAKKGGDSVVVEECFDIENPRACGSFLKRFFSRYPDTKGIFVSNASGHTVASYLLNRGKKPGVALLCYDLVPDNIRGLQEGGIDCVLSQRPEQQTYLGLFRLYHTVVLGQACENRIRMPLDVHFRENLEHEIDFGAQEEY